MRNELGANLTNPSTLLRRGRRDLAEEGKGQVAGAKVETILCFFSSFFVIVVSFLFRNFLSRKVGRVRAPVRRDEQWRKTAFRCGVSFLRDVFFSPEEEISYSGIMIELFMPVHVGFSLRWSCRSGTPDSSHTKTMDGCISSSTRRGGFRGGTRQGNPDAGDTKTQKTN